jgi:hypothetical protein
MGTSNWQNTPFCVEVLMKIAPQRVLDVGVGYGRWGMVIREFCDVWYGRVNQKDWAVQIEGIEAFKNNIDAYHQYFYNHIYLDDFRSVYQTLMDSYDVIIFGDVLEHFEKEEATSYLTWAIHKSKYVIVNIPIGENWQQDETYENVYEKHLSTWVEEDFAQFPLCRFERYFDFLGRTFGSYIFSKKDPVNISEKLFSIYTNNEAQPRFNVPSDVQAALYELESIKISRSYQLLNQIKDSKVGQIAIKIYLFLKRRIFKKKQASYLIGHSLTKSEWKPGFPKQSATQVNTLPIRSEHEAWIKQTPPGSVISIQHPHWLGIQSSASQLFDHLLDIPDDLDEIKAKYYIKVLNAVSPSAVVVQGFPASYHFLFRALQKSQPAIPIYAIWHGSFLHTDEDAAWNAFEYLWHLTNQGVIQKWGFAKAGMAETISSHGLRTGFIQNYVRQLPNQASLVEPSPVKFGVWASAYSSWRKAPYAMLAAVSDIPDARVTFSGHDRERVMAFSQRFNIALDYHQSIPPEKMPAMLAAMHLNLYVTLNECTPMLPLESLSVGAPCLLGPNSHLFEEDPYLFSRLVVPFPDRAEVIKKYAQQALEERDLIVAKYVDYAREYNLQAQNRLVNFLDGRNPRKFTDGLR